MTVTVTVQCDSDSYNWSQECSSRNIASAAYNTDIIIVSVWTEIIMHVAVTATSISLELQK